MARRLMAGLRHVVLFRWKDGTTDADIAAIDEGLATLPVAIPELVDYRYGRDAGLAEDSWDYAIVADVASMDDYVTYRDDAAHQAVIAERIRPHVAERAAVQHHVP